MKPNHITEKQFCLSTHGGAGYAPDSYWDGDAIVCGACGYRIENPPPQGDHIVYYSFWEHPLNWLRNRPKAYIPIWPPWIKGEREEIK